MSQTNAPATHASTGQKCRAEINAIILNELSTVNCLEWRFGDEIQRRRAKK